MSLNKETLNMQLLGKPYTLNCESHEIPRLKEAVQYLEQKTRILHATYKSATTERLAIMAALDLAHELLTQRAESVDYKDALEVKMRSLTATLSDALETV